jgi:hypothetical protein
MPASINRRTFDVPGGIEERSQDSGRIRGTAHDHSAAQASFQTIALKKTA